MRPRGAILLSRIATLLPRGAMLHPHDVMWAVAGIALLAAAMRLHAVGVGFAMDDYAQLAMLADAYPVRRAPWDLFAFCDGSSADIDALVDAGAFPWWSDPTLRLSTLRPLPSLLTWFDVRAFGLAPRLHHLHTFAWWLAMLAVVARLLLRMLPARWAVLAFALYALDECHAQPLAWLANRNAIVAATFGMAAVHAHVVAREGGRGGALAAVWLAFALACGEGALGALGFIAAVEIAGQGSPRPRALVPIAIVVLAWAGIHAAGGYGAGHSGVYVDPVDEPLRWLVVAAQRVPILIADLALALPTGRLALGGRGLLAQQVAGVLAMLAIAWWLRRVAPRGDAAESVALRTFALGTLFAVLPMASAFVSARLLVIPAIGAHVLIAHAVLAGLAAWRRHRWTARARVALAAVLLAAHGLAAPWWSIREITEVRTFAADARRAAASAPFDAGTDVVVLVAADPATLLYPPLVRAATGLPPPRSYLVLSAAPGTHRLRRTGAHTLELEHDAGMLRGAVEQMFRRDDRLPEVGARRHVGDAVVEVRAVDGEGHPTRVAVTFATPIDDPTLRFVLATPAGFVRYPLGPVGVAVTLPPAAAPSR